MGGPEPAEQSLPPFVEVDIRDRGTAPQQHGYGDGEVVDHRVDVQGARPAESGEDAPARIGQVIGEYAGQKDAVLARRARGHRRLADDHVEVDDYVDHHRQNGDR